MKKQNRKLVILLFALAAPIVSWILFRGMLNNRAMLADGTRLTALSVVANTNAFYAGNFVERLLGPKLPLVGFQWRNIRIRPVKHYSHIKSSGDYLTLWLLLDHGGKSHEELLQTWCEDKCRIIAFDNQGIEFENRFVGLEAVRTNDALLPLRLTAFPRDKAKFGVRLLHELSPNNWTNVAQFWVKNPDVVAQENWPAQILPVTNSFNNARVVLSRLEVKPRLLPNAPNNSDVSIEFLLHTNQSEPTEWELQECVVRDGVGNFYSADLDVWTKNWFRYDSSLSFNPDETWKIEVELNQKTNFERADLVTFRIFPDGKDYSAINQSGMSMTGKLVNGAIEYGTNDPENLRVTFISATTDEGKEAEVVGSGAISLGRIFLRHQKQLSRTPKFADATFALRKRILLDYYVRPETIKADLR